MRNELRKLHWEMTHFRYNILFANLSFVLFIGGVLQTLPQGQPELTLVMLLVWYISVHGFSIPSLILEEEILEGTLVYMVLSEKGLFRVLLDKCAAQVFYDTLKGLIMFLPLAFLIFGVLPSWGRGILPLLPLLLSVGTTYALGLSIAALSFKFKQLGSVPSLLYYFVFFFESGLLEGAEPSYSPLSPFLPFSFLRNFLLNRNPLFLLFLALQFCFWASIAKGCYNHFYREMLRQGTVDHV